MVLEEHKREPVGVLRMARRLRKGHAISYSNICRIMKGNGLVTPPAAKSRKRKWIRCEGRHSNSMWHTDWHIMKDPRFRGLNLIAFLDGASRHVTGAALFTEATSGNAWQCSGRQSKGSEPRPRYSRTTDPVLSVFAERNQKGPGSRPCLRASSWTGASS